MSYRQNVASDTNHGNKSVIICKLLLPYVVYLLRNRSHFFPLLVIFRAVGCIGKGSSKKFFGINSSSSSPVDPPPPTHLNENIRNQIQLVPHEKEGLLL